MIAISEKGVLSDANVNRSQPYLARIADRYLVVIPHCPQGTTREEIPWKEAVFIDPMDKQQKPVSILYEMHEIF